MIKAKMFHDHDPVKRTLLFARELFRQQGAKIEQLIPKAAGELGYDYDVTNRAVTRFTKYCVGVSHLPQRELPRWVILSAFNLAIEDEDEFVG